MYTDAADRRRIAVATVITLVALPALWLSGRDDASDGGSQLAVVGAGAVDAALVATVSSAPDGSTIPDDGGDPFLPSDPVFLAGPSLPAAPEPQVVYADPGPARHVTGSATFKRNDPAWGAQACHSSSAPANAFLTVTNVNNGRSTTCTNVTTRPLAAGIVIVLDTEAFLEIADLVEAPLPVLVSW